MNLREINEYAEVIEGINIFDIDTDIRIDMELVKENALHEYGIFQTIDDDPRRYSRDLQMHFNLKHRELTKLLDTYELKYNPIEDYSISRKSTHNDKFESTRKNDFSNTTNDETNMYHSAYNQTNDDVSLTNKNNGEQSSNGSSNSIDDNTRNIEESEVISGLNKSTYQDLIKREREIALFNIYDWILKNIIAETLIWVW